MVEEYIEPLTINHDWLSDGAGNMFCSYCGANQETASENCPRVGM